jgi:hypothetical protein
MSSFFYDVSLFFPMVRFNSREEDKMALYPLSSGILTGNEAGSIGHTMSESWAHGGIVDCKAITDCVPGQI